MEMFGGFDIQSQRPGDRIEHLCGGVLVTALL
jgi:hypothetical protein